MKHSTITKIVKRDGADQPFDLEKITNAILGAFRETEAGGEKEAKKVADLTFKKIVEYCEHPEEKETQDDRSFCANGKPTVEEIQDVVEESLMELEYFDTAKAYILYRSARAEERERDLFKKRKNLKPYEYPEFEEFVDAIRHSYWVHTEFNYTSDIQDFKVNVDEKDRNAIKNAMLAIAQIEVAVKAFWGDIYKHIPKPEVAAVGFTFAESEVRHADAYAHLLYILDLSKEFEKIDDIPAFKKRVDYLNQSLVNAQAEDDREYLKSVLLFSLFIEHVSLFSQFLIIMSYNKHKNLFKGMSNAVEATSKEEQIHGLFGIEIINLARAEHPEWFDEKFEEEIYEACKKAYETEAELVDWIYEKGELDFLPGDTVKAFVKNRLNNELESIGLERIFEVDEKLVEETDWFDDEVIATKHGDFFVKRSINYNKRSQSVTGDDLF